MNDSTTDVLDDAEPASAEAALPSGEFDDDVDVLDDLDAIADESELDEAELIAKLQRSMADFEAGRYRPAKEVMREIAAEHGFTLEG
jgi:hypothetical protein